MYHDPAQYNILEHNAIQYKRIQQCKTIKQNARQYKTSNSYKKPPTANPLVMRSSKGLDKTDGYMQRQRWREKETQSDRDKNEERL